MRWMILTIAAAALAAAQEKSMPEKTEPPETMPEKHVTVKRLTPNLYTDDVRACVKFWVERMHFEKTNEVPDGANLAFAILQKGNIELMYGSYASLARESGEIPRSFQRGTGFLFIEVENLDAVVDAMRGAPVIAPVHKTFYGATEFTVKDPAGHFITFASF
jgi:uncharacterized glyoxalase superfamily protein PhnB